MTTLGALLAIVALLTITVAAGFTLRRWRSAVQRVDTAEIIEPARLGAERLGDRATLLQFSTELCTRCPGVHRTLASIADAKQGVLHLDVDLTHRPDIARHFRLLQTPTTLILDRDGAIQARLGGAPPRDVVELELDRVTRMEHAGA
ncbi:TlpA family protein disulfide reductase [Microbacterium sp.]|uniref:TlpA family protein disulfide reductase n=1 Tax=Microbacterium sp. TaxID=51671 RepID=UPI0037C50ECF